MPLGPVAPRARWLWAALACSIHVTGVRSKSLPGSAALPRALATWTQHTFFDPSERTVSPPPALERLNPPLLDPKKEGSFARHTLTTRLPAVCMRMIKEGASEADALRAIADEIPAQPLRPPREIRAEDKEVDAGCLEWFNRDWETWTKERAAGAGEKEPWAAALPLISTEMYLYRRCNDVTFFEDGIDPYTGQKNEALASALRSDAFLKAVKLAVGSEGEQRGDVTKALILADLWGNQGDLALAPLDSTNTGAAERIKGNSEGRLLVDEISGALEALESPEDSQVDIICDNAGIELLCDLLLAFHLEQKGKKVVLHVKGEPLFVSDAMRQDVESHVCALEEHPDESVRSLGAGLRAKIGAGICVESHMLWTSPRLFWEMPLSLAGLLAKSSLCIVKGDANFRRLVGDRVWPPTTPLCDVVQPWFPAPMLALRTLKAEIAVGMQEGEAETLSREHAGWMVTGDFATAQFVPLVASN